MSEYALPVLFALFLWWFSTGAILYLDGLPQRTFKWSMAGAVVVLVAGFWGLSVSSNDASVNGAYAAFASGLAIWAWQEISFYMGYLTGPRKKMCADGCSGWRHFGHALQVSLYHELSIIVSAAVCLWLTWDAPNQVGLWTFVILWWMHESARLNVFLGVRNVSEAFLPPHLAYLKSFLRVRTMNWLFPFSVTISTAILAWLIWKTASASTPFDIAFYAFLSGIMGLAVLEHWFLMLPLPFEKLWSWGLLSRKSEPIVVDEKPSKPSGDTRSNFIQDTDDLYEFDMQREKGRRIGARYG
ncbi:MAG: putative photosynthetic complex assembly protein PuhE [Rhodomicrobiaceae bacterium]